MLSFTQVSHCSQLQQKQAFKNCYGLLKKLRSRRRCQEVFTLPTLYICGPEPLIGSARYIYGKKITCMQQKMPDIYATTGSESEIFPDFRFFKKYGKRFGVFIVNFRLPLSFYSDFQKIWKYNLAMRPVERVYSALRQEKYMGHIQKTIT